MSKRLLNIDCHSDDPVPTLRGLATALKTMRWEDLNDFANQLDDVRRGGEDRSSRRRLQAQDIWSWLEGQLDE